MKNNHLAMQQNPNHAPYQTNPLPIYHHQNQDPSFNPPQPHYFYPPVIGQQNAYPPPPGNEHPLPVTVTVSYVPNPDPSLSWGAAYAPVAAPYSAGVTLPSGATQLPKNNNVKNAPKKTKIVQSLWCEVCKIDCNSKDVLDNHKLGKKHKRNLEKLRGPPIVTPAAPASVPSSLAIVPAAPPSIPLPESASVITAAPAPVIAHFLAPTSANPIIGPLEKLDGVMYSNAKRAKRRQAVAPAIVPAAPAIAPLTAPTSANPIIIRPLEKPDGAMSSNAKKAKRRKSAASVDVETKFLKVLGEGAAAESIRTCMYCNVVCNSETVYGYHIAGHKHAANVKKHALLVGSASAV